jgi:hypothetical protein
MGDGGTLAGHPLDHMGLDSFSDLFSPLTGKVRPKDLVTGPSS